MTPLGWIVLALVVILAIPAWLKSFLRYWTRLRVTLRCWEVQGRTIGIEGTVRNMFHRSCSFHWTCKCLLDLVGAEDSVAGKLLEGIRACWLHQNFRETLFDTVDDCTTVTIHTMAPGVGPRPSRPLWLALQIQGCRGRVVLSIEDALWLWWQLRFQAEQCCWT